MKRSSAKLSKKSPESSRKVIKRENRQKVSKIPKRKRTPKKTTGPSKLELKKTSRPLDEVVVYREVEFQTKELIPDGNHVLIGPPRLTRFERARITGARSLQLSLGAPSLISWNNKMPDTISIATAELDARALPISIRRILPNGLYQDIPIDWMR